METKENNSGNFFTFFNYLQGIPLIKLPVLCNYWSNQIDKIIVFCYIFISKKFVNSKSGNPLSSYTCNPATADLITKTRKSMKPFKGKLWQRHVARMSGSCLSMINGEILPSHFEI